MMVNISPSAMCVNGDDVWLAHAKLNAFFRYNLRTRETEFCGSLPDRSPYREAQDFGIHYYAGKLYFVPAFASSFVVYGIDTKEFSKVVLSDTKSSDGRLIGQLIASFAEDKHLYCVPFYSDYFLVFDMECRKIVKKITWKSSDDVENVHINKSFKSGDRVYCLIPSRKGELLVWHKGGLLERVNIKGDEIGYSSGCTMDSKIYLFSFETNMIYEFADIRQRPVNAFKVPYADGGNIISLCGEHLLHDDDGTHHYRCIFGKDFSTHVISLTPCRRLAIDYGYLTVLPAECGDATYIYDRYDNHLYEIKQNKTIRHIVAIDSEIIKGAYSKWLSGSDRQRFYTENCCFNLEGYIYELECGLR